jgi:outer membrane protein TolC
MMPRLGWVRRGTALAAACSALLVSGCRLFSPDGGMALVSGVVAQDLEKQAVALRSPAEEAWVRQRLDQLLARPLTADAAVQVALFSNRGLQAAYNRLFAAEAAAVEASLPPNPTLNITRLFSGVEAELERQIVFNVLALATLPARTAVAQDRFLAAKFRAIEETLRIAAETRRAYYNAVGAQQLAALLAQTRDAAETAARLSVRLGETGALNKLDQTRNQVLYAEIVGQLAIMRLRARSERERLTRLMGLWGTDTEFKLPTTLPPLPAAPRALPLVEREAVARRADLQIARLELAALAKSLGLTRATRFINVLEISGIANTVREGRTGESFTQRGFEIELQVPIFDFGEARVRQAEQTYLEAVNRLAERAVNVRSEAREAYARYRAQYEIARHYRSEVVPLRRLISEELLLRYNAMQVDVFELLTESRQRLSANVTAAEALRDFWLADADLNTALVGGGIRGSETEARTPAANGGSAPQH